jgi:hypothetical protein
LLFANKLLGENIPRGVVDVEVVVVVVSKMVVVGGVVVVEVEGFGLVVGVLVTFYQLLLF